MRRLSAAVLQPCSCCPSAGCVKEISSDERLERETRNAGR